MKHRIVYISIFILSVTLVGMLSAGSVLALQTGVATGQLDAAGGATGLNSTATQDPRIFVATLVQYLLGILGTLFTALILLGGYYYFIARGREDYIQKAKSTMLRAVVGLVIIMISYTVTVFVKGLVSNLG
jgi:hypothetical protein